MSATKPPAPRLQLLPALRTGFWRRWRPRGVWRRLLELPWVWVTLLVAPDSPQFATLGAAATGISVPSQWAPQVTYKPTMGPTPADFTQRFQAKYNLAQGYHAAGGYAAGLVLHIQCCSGHREPTAGRDGAARLLG